MSVSTKIPGRSLEHSDPENAPWTVPIKTNLTSPLKALSSSMTTGPPIKNRLIYSKSSIRSRLCIILNPKFPRLVLKVDF